MPRTILTNRLPPTFIPAEAASKSGDLPAPTRNCNGPESIASPLDSFVAVYRMATTWPSCGISAPEPGVLISLYVRPSTSICLHVRSLSESGASSAKATAGRLRLWLRLWLWLRRGAAAETLCEKGWRCLGAIATKPRATINVDNNMKTGRASRAKASAERLLLMK